MHRTEYGHIRIILGHFHDFWYVVTVVTFGTPVAFWYTEDRSVFSTLGIIPSQFWHIWCTLAHFTFGTPVGTLSVVVGTPSSFLAHLDHSWSLSARLVQSVCLVRQLRLVN